MAGISTHILDTAIGRPAAGVAVSLRRRGRDGEWQEIGQGVTNEDGRCGDLLGGTPLTVGEHLIEFATGQYHERQGIDGFYPAVEIQFTVNDASQHYHVPLLLNPFGYSTYRGS